MYFYYKKTKKHIKKTKKLGLSIYCIKGKERGMNVDKNKRNKIDGSFTFKRKN